MKLIKRLFILIFAISCLFGVVGCSCGKDKEEDEPSTPSEIISNISDVLASSNNTSCVIKGIVYGKTNEGFYVSDSTGKIFVANTSYVLVGQEVKVTGTFAIVNKMPEVKKCSVVTYSSGNETLNYTEKTIKEISELDSNKRTNYFEYIKTQGTISYLTSGSYEIHDKDGNSILFDSESNISQITKWTNKTVYIEVIVHNYTSEGWTVSYCKTSSDITEVPLNIEDVKAEIFDEVEKKQVFEAFSSVEFVESSSLYPNVGFNWTVKSGEYITIEDNIATITRNESSTDAENVITLTLKYDTQTVSKDYTFIVKAVKEYSINDINTNKVELNSIVIVNGTVVMKAKSNGSIYSVIITDGNGEYARIDGSDALVSSFNYGDTVKVVGEYSLSNGIKRIYSESIERTKTADEGSTLELYNLQATELKTVEEYDAIGVACNSEFGAPVKLYKIYEPYVTTSSTSSYNYYRFGATAASAKDGINKRYYAFSIAAGKYTFDSSEDELAKYLTIGAYQSGAIQNVGVTIYAFNAYNIESITNTQFVTTYSGIVNNVETLLEQELDKIPAELDGSKECSITLPEDLCGITLNWSSDNAAINVVTGTTSIVNEDTEVTLTVSCVINEVPVEKSVKVKLTVTDMKYMSVTDFVNSNKTAGLNVTVTVVGFATGTKDTNAEPCIDGVYVSDGKSVVMLTGLTYNSTTNGYDAYYVVDGNRVYCNDVLNIKGASKVGDTLSVTEESTVEYVASSSVKEESKMVWNPDCSNVVSSKADFATVLAQGSGTFFKVVATEENPLCFGSSKATDQSICLTNKVRIYFYEGVASPGVAGIKPDGTHVVATKTICSELTLGTEWWASLAEGFALTTNSTSTAKKFTGEFYCMLTATTTGFFMVSILAPGFNLTQYIPAN